jgi:hypothetical protein
MTVRVLVAVLPQVIRRHVVDRVRGHLRRVDQDVSNHTSFNLCAVLTANTSVVNGKTSELRKVRWEGNISTCPGSKAVGPTLRCDSDL